MSTVKSTDLLAITRPSGGDAGTYKVAVSDLPHAVPATETAAGIVELATAVETQAGTDGTRAGHPAGLKAVTDAERATSDAQYVDVAGDTMTGNLTVPSLNSGPLAGFRNQIINGDFRINQRNGTRTPGVGVYGFDRWKGHAGGLEQIVEALPAGQWTLSWSGGGNGTFDGTTAASPITATVAGGNTSVVVPSNATNVQLEHGPVATPFEHRPIGTELALCQRYYYVYATSGLGDAPTASSQYSGGYTTAPNTSLAMAIAHPVTMRINPTALSVHAIPTAPTRITSNGIIWAASWTSNPGPLIEVVCVLSAGFDAEF